MHYYKRNVGDYAKKAGRLTMLQHGAYTLLMDACYDREEFPTLEQAIDWTWASTEAEVEAVKFVLTRFFAPDSDGRYVQNRILEELLSYHKTAENNKRIAEEREAKRKRNSTERANGSTERAQDETERDANVNGASHDVYETPPNHKPLTTNHKPKEEKIKTNRTQQAACEQKPPDAVVSRFAEIRAAYPERGGSQRWKDAERAYNANLKAGTTHEQMLAGVQRYAQFIHATGKTKTEWVQQAATFLGRNAAYAELWAAPNEVQDIRHMSAVDRVKFRNSQNGSNLHERVVSTQGRQDFGSLVEIDRLVR